MTPFILTTNRYQKFDAAMLWSSLGTSASADAKNSSMDRNAFVREINLSTWHRSGSDAATGPLRSSRRFRLRAARESGRQASCNCWPPGAMHRQLADTREEAQEDLLEVQSWTFTTRHLSLRLRREPCKNDFSRKRLVHEPTGHGEAARGDLVLSGKSCAEATRSRWPVGVPSNPRLCSASRSPASRMFMDAQELSGARAA